ncbi:MAG: Putative Glycosyl transferase, partial [Microgenomates bacterium 39_6]
MINRAALYTPYPDTLGGGERYLLSLAQILLDSGWRVESTLDEGNLIKARSRFNLPLKDLNFIPQEYLIGKQKLFYHHRYDLLFWVSDGSIPTMMAKKNWLHFQVPFHGKGERGLFNIMKLKMIDKFICNSFFTKSFIDQEYGVTSEVWYPPVAIEEFSPAAQKTNSIVAVGRFENTMNVKRQDVLVTVFKKLVDDGLKKWQLVLIGGSQSLEKENTFLQTLKQSAFGYPIKFLVNAPFSDLKKTYSQAKIFWHAAGFGFDE